MKLTRKQQQLVANANSRINICDGAVRTGKTIGLNFRWLKFIMQVEEANDWSGKGELIMFGVTAQSVYRNVVKPLEEAVGKALTYSSSQQKIKLYGKDIYIFGANDVGAESKIRGLTVGGALGDEITLVHETFFKQVLARMSVEGAKLFGGTNPDNPRHYIKKDFLDREGEIDLFHQHYILEDNKENLGSEYVESLKAELSGVFYDRFILGKWVASEGLVYEFFDENNPDFVSATRDDIEAERYYIAGLDYGIQNPTAMEIFAVNERHSEGRPAVLAIDEYYYCGRENESPKTDSELADDIEDKLQPYLSKLHAIYIDPSASSLIQELKRRGLPVKAAVNDVVEGIKSVAKMNKSGDYRISRYGCPMLIEERYLYKWDAKASLTLGIDKPMKVDDHCSDGERYAIHTHFKSKKAGIGNIGLTQM